MTLKRSVVRTLILALLGGDDEVGLVECLEKLGIPGIDYITTKLSDRDNVIGTFKRKIQEFTVGLVGERYSSDEEEDKEGCCKKYLMTLTLELVDFPKGRKKKYIEEKICKEGGHTIFMFKYPEENEKRVVYIDPLTISLTVTKLFSAAFGAFDFQQSNLSHKARKMALIKQLKDSTLKGIMDLRNELFENLYKEESPVDVLSSLNMLSSLVDGVLLMDEMINNQQANGSKASTEIELYDKHTGSLFFKKKFVDPLSKDGAYISDDRHVMHHFFLVSTALLRELSFLILYLGSNGKNSKGFLNLLDEITYSKTEVNDKDRKDFFDNLADKAQDNLIEYISDPKHTPWMVNEIGRDRMKSRVNLIPHEILNFLTKNSVISEERRSEVLSFLISPLIKELLMNRKIYELAVLAAIAHDGLPILTSHSWIIKLSGSTEERKEEFENTLNNLAKKKKRCIQKSDNAYSTDEIDGLFLLKKDILKDIDHLSFLSEKDLWDRGCDSIVVLLEVTVGRSAGKDELEGLRDKVRFVNEVLHGVQSGHDHVAGVLIVREEIKKDYEKLKENSQDDIPILVESIENMFSQDGRLELYSSIIDEITKRIDRSGKLVFPTLSF